MQLKTFRPNKKVLGKKLDNEWVFLNLENGVYYGLNETGSLIWEALSAKEDLEAAIERLQEIFQVERATIEKDLKRFLKDIKKEGLAEIESLPA